MEITDQIVDFSLATSVLRLNCSGLEPGVAITAAKFKGAGNKSILKITKAGGLIGYTLNYDGDILVEGCSVSDITMDAALAALKTGETLEIWKVGESLRLFLLLQIPRMF